MKVLAEGMTVECITVPQQDYDQLVAERNRYKHAVDEVSTHLGAIKAIIAYAIATKPSRCLLTEKYDGICPHCESDISWLEHELKAHGEYSAEIEKALSPEAP